MCYINKKKKDKKEAIQILESKRILFELSHLNVTHVKENNVPKGDVASQ